MADPEFDPDLTEQFNIDVKPTPEPDEEPADAHQGPLDHENDARYLDPVDPRRRKVEQLRGRPFADDQEA
jgi:hypothetical protein